MEKNYIPTEREARVEGRSLILKLLICPDRFTVMEMSRLTEILAAEGHTD